jgi:hypothetical protein
MRSVRRLSGPAAAIHAGFGTTSMTAQSGAAWLSGALLHCRGHAAAHPEGERRGAAGALPAAMELRPSN